MHLIETTITQTAVHMRYANDADRTKATYWIDFQVPLSDLKLPAGQGEDALGDPQHRLLAEVQVGALRHVRGEVGAESQRLLGLLDPTRR